MYLVPLMVRRAEGSVRKTSAHFFGVSGPEDPLRPLPQLITAMAKTLLSGAVPPTGTPGVTQKACGRDVPPVVLCG